MTDNNTTFFLELSGILAIFSRIKVNSCSILLIISAPFSSSANAAAIILIDCLISSNVVINGITMTGKPSSRIIETLSAPVQPVAIIKSGFNAIISSADGSLIFSGIFLAFATILELTGSSAKLLIPTKLVVGSIPKTIESVHIASVKIRLGFCGICTVVPIASTTV